MAVRAQTARRSSNREQRKEAAWGLGFASIWLIGFIVFAAFPLIMAVFISFTSWNPVSGPFWQAHGNGFNNYHWFLTSQRFWHSVWNSIYYSIGSVAVMNLVALPMAMLLNQRLRGLNIYRTIFYLPAILPAVATALIFRLIFLPGTGVISWLLTTLHIQCDTSSAACNPLDWLGDPHLTMPVVIVMTAWGVGQPILIYLAGLQGIDQSFYEAASIDGASSWQRFRAITIPLLTPAIFFNIVTGLISAFQEFGKLVIVAGGTGSPSGIGGPSDSLLTTFVLVYQTGFSFDEMGRATAMAFGLFALILIFTLINFWGQRRWVFYQEER